MIKPNASTGYPEEILIMDNPDISQAVKVWRWNSGGLGHSNSGYNSQSYNIALTADGKINASAITTGILNADLLRTGTITDQTGTTSINLSNGAVTISQTNGGKILINSGGVFAQNANGDTPVRIFIAQNGVTGAIDTDIIYIGSGTVITTNSFRLNGENYVPRQITVDGVIYTVLAQ